MAEAKKKAARPDRAGWTPGAASGDPSARSPAKNGATWPPIKKDPSPRQIDASQAAKDRNDQRRPPLPFEARMGESGQLQIAGNLSDEHVAWNRLQDVCGTTSNAWIDGIVSGLVNARGGKADGAPGTLLEGLAFLNGVAPRDEVEAALGAQMFAVHSASMNLVQRMASAEMRDQFRDYGNLLVKTTRTFAAQVEALAKLRNGGKQTVEVRYVYVDARGGQNVIGSEIVAGAGAGGGGLPSESRRQSLEPSAFAGLPFAPGAAMWGQEQGGLAVSGAGDAAQAPVSPSRRESRSADRSGQWRVQARPEDEGTGGGAPHGAGAGQKREDDPG